MHTVENGVSVKTLAEIALLASRVGREVIADRREPSAGSLRQFWQQTRALQQHWLRKLDAWNSAGDPDLKQLEEVATQLFITELLARVWSTVLLGVDSQTGKNDLSRVARNAVSGLLQVRHVVMSLLVQQAESTHSRIAEIERLRRRSDRWTDLLIGNLAGQHDLFEFAFDVERARDFALESQEYHPATGPHPIDHLVTAGLRMAFLGQLPEALLTEEPFIRLVESIVGAMPHQAFHSDGTLKSPLERRVSATQLRDQQIPSSLLNPESDSADEDGEPDTIPFPGINFSRLRRRPK